MNECEYVCGGGTTWFFVSGTCPEEEACRTPTEFGALNDRKRVPCLPIGTGTGGEG